MEKKLSIVIPVYNRGEIVGRTLRSVEAQTYRPLKVILVDNASTDNTASVLAAWRDQTASHDFEVTIVAETTPGAAAARNKGLEMVDTPWVMFFDSDDTMHPAHCSRAMEAADKSDADIVGWDVNIHLPGGTTTGRTVGKRPIFDCIFHGSMATQRWCARTALVRNAGAWNPQAYLWNDIELGTRMLSCGASICRLKGQPTVDVMYSPVSITNQPWPQRLANADKVTAMMKASLPENCRHYADFKRILAAGEAMRLCTDYSVRSAARHMYSSTLSNTYSRQRRTLMRLAFTYSSHIPHGSVAILSLFLK